MPRRKIRWPGTCVGPAARPGGQGVGLLRRLGDVTTGGPGSFPGALPGGGAGSAGAVGLLGGSGDVTTGVPARFPARRAGGRRVRPGLPCTTPRAGPRFHPTGDPDHPEPGHRPHPGAPRHQTPAAPGPPGPRARPHHFVDQGVCVRLGPRARHKLLGHRCDERRSGSPEPTRRPSYEGWARVGFEILVRPRPLRAVSHKISRSRARIAASIMRLAAVRVRFVAVNFMIDSARAGAGAGAGSGDGGGGGGLGGDLGWGFGGPGEFGGGVEGDAGGGPARALGGQPAAEPGPVVRLAG